MKKMNLEPGLAVVVAVAPHPRNVVAVTLCSGAAYVCVYVNVYVCVYVVCVPVCVCGVWTKQFPRLRK